MLEHEVEQIIPEDEQIPEDDLQEEELHLLLQDEEQDEGEREEQADLTLYLIHGPQSVNKFECEAHSMAQKKVLVLVNDPNEEVFSLGK